MALEDSSSMVRLLAAASGSPIAVHFALLHGHLVCRCAFGATAPELAPLTGLWHRILEQDDVLALDDLFSEEGMVEQLRYTPGAGLRACAGVRIRAPDGSPIGVLCIVNQLPGGFGETARKSLLDARRLLERDLVLRHQAERDALTDLINRRRMEQVLTREWRRALRETAPLSVVAIDVDRFKSVNDAYGHQAGDAALRAVAAAMRRTFQRPGDISARIGGDEFLACLPQTDALAATQLAEILRAEVEASCGFGETEGLTISLGVASVRVGVDHTTDHEALLLEADAALYQAKSSGRNRVAVAGLPFSRVQ